MFVCCMDPVSIRTESINDRNAVLINVIGIRTGHRMDFLGLKHQGCGDISGAADLFKNLFAGRRTGFLITVQHDKDFMSRQCTGFF